MLVQVFWNRHTRPSSSIDTAAATHMVLVLLAERRPDGRILSVRTVHRDCQCGRRNRRCAPVRSRLRRVADHIPALGSPGHGSIGTSLTHIETLVSCLLHTARAVCGGRVGLRLRLRLRLPAQSRLQLQLEEPRPARQRSSSASLRLAGMAAFIAASAGPHWQLRPNIPYMTLSQTQQKRRKFQ